MRKSLKWWINDCALFIRHTFFEIKESLKPKRPNLNLEAWLTERWLRKVYFIFFIAFTLRYFLSHDTLYFRIAVLSLIVVFFISFLIRYSSGRHRGEARKELRERVRRQYENGKL